MGKNFIVGQTTELAMFDDSQPMSMREHGMAWHSIYGQNVLESSNIVLMETA